MENIAIRNALKRNGVRAWELAEALNCKYEKLKNIVGL